MLCVVRGFSLSDRVSVVHLDPFSVLHLLVWAGGGFWRSSEGQRVGRSPLVIECGSGQMDLQLGGWDKTSCANPALERCRSISSPIQRNPALLQGEYRQVVLMTVYTSFLECPLICPGLNWKEFTEQLVSVC
ncbi:Ephrin Type-A Receptor 7 [Manis pentadactyla]|nr:Ephrin Type-A Receptor 7 [Manis pentadactyla]